MGTLNLSWPFGNRAARGLMAQRQAEEQQTQLRGNVLARSIQSGVLVAFQDLEHTREEVVRTRAAQDHYKDAIEQEKVRLGVGNVSILDVITLADRADTAKFSAATAQARYAIALARVRYETGTLVQPGATPDSPLSLSDLTTLPDSNPALEGPARK
jgi:outer membrane protein TolC